MNQSGKHRVITFERTADLTLIREILTEPACWRRMTDDGAPSIEQFSPGIRHGLVYVVALEDGRPIALFVLVGLVEQIRAAEVHFCFRPEAWGHTEAIARAFVEWIWQAAPLDSLIGPVPEHNRLALQLAAKVGMTEFARETRAVKRRGKYYDRILMKIRRPDAPYRREAGDPPC